MTRFHLQQTPRRLSGLGLSCLALGYTLLAVPPVDGPWSLSVAPILLVLGYGVFIPWAVLRVGHGRQSPPAPEASTTGAPTTGRERRTDRGNA
ncbi:MAG: hypothetical protein WDA75_15145 [Candidatus Latescibacterota bacterium]|jgi:hypothetical protein